MLASNFDGSIIDQSADWGTTISEATAKRTPFSRFLLIVACILLMIGSMLLIPLIAGTLLFTSNGAATEMLLIGGLLALAIAFKKKSSDLPRNALQIDYMASELRLGSELPNGLFLREQVVNFRDVQEAYVDTNGEAPVLCLSIPGELITLDFNQAEEAELHALANRISAAHESALRAPIRSRIQSRMRGFEASFQEVKSRVRSRITRPI